MTDGGHRGRPAAQVVAARDLLTGRGARADVLAAAPGTLQARGGGSVEADLAIATTGSVFYDAVLVPGGPDAVRELAEEPVARRFVDRPRLYT